MDHGEPGIGEEIGGFRLESVIGKGGMGRVYKAVQLRLNRGVALKILPPATMVRSRKRLQRFLREAQVAAQLSHPNIVQVYDAGEERGIFYMAMELVEGRDLRATISSGGPLEEHRACEVFLQCARALQAALEKNLIHRDIKPDNIMITDKGVVKVADFGLARDLASEARITATGAILGTPAFMSPEQGKGDDVDHRSDLYSLGATLYFAVTARFPFFSEQTSRIIHMHINDPLPDPRQFRAELSDGLVLVIRRLMAKAPIDRYQTVTSLIGDLEALCGPTVSPAMSGLASTVTDSSVVSHPGVAPSAVTTGTPGSGLAARGEPSQETGQPLDTLEVPREAFRHDLGTGARFAMETADDFGDEAEDQGHTLAEVESSQFQLMPGLERCRDMTQAILRVRGFDPVKKVFLFSRGKIRIGRQGKVSGPDGRELDVDLILRALPCRSRDKDPENYRRNLSISRFHAAIRLADGEVFLDGAPGNQGLSVNGKKIPKEEPFSLPEECEVAFSNGALALQVRLFAAGEAGKVFRIEGEPRAEREGFVGMEGAGRISAVRLERHVNARHHTYVLLARQARIGPDDEAPVRVPDTGVGARLYYYNREYLLAAEEGGKVAVDGRDVGPGFLAPLSPGAVIRVGEAVMEFRDLKKDAFKEL